MAFGKEAIEQLSQELVRGHNLNTRLLALLRHPLDRRGQGAAVAMSQELSRVFMVSLFMLKSGQSQSHDSGRVVEVEMVAPEVTITEGSIGQRTLAKDKHICGGEDVTLPKKGREDKVTEMEITASPHKDGYQWRKYGQKKIHNRKFARCYYKCMFSHDRGCRAKKKVQQQDNSRGRHPMFQVTYMNEHKCQQQLPDETVSAATLTTTKRNTTAGRDHFDPQHAQLENDIMASCLGMVIGGADAPSAPLPSTSSPLLPVEASLGDPDGGHTSRLLDIDETNGAEISCGSPLPPAKASAAPSSSLCLPHRLPVEAIPSDTSVDVPAGSGHYTSMDTFFPCSPLFYPFAAQSVSQSDDATITVAAPLIDTALAWPQHFES